MFPLLIPVLGAGVLVAANMPPDTEKRAPISVPVANIPQTAWLAFVRAFYNPSVVNGVSDTFRYGVFGMTVRRLVDLGVMTEPKTFTLRGKLVWSGKWIPPLDLKSFAADKNRQYDLFAQSIRQYSEDLRVSNKVGTEIEGERASLSGLLGIAHRGGLPGLESWISDPIKRTKFSHTTDVYRRANNLF